MGVHVTHACIFILTDFKYFSRVDTMNINPINNIINTINLHGKTAKKTNEPAAGQNDKLMKELDKMSMINNVNIGKKDFELNLSMEELRKRTHKDYLTTKKMLAADAPEYLELLPPR